MEEAEIEAVKREREERNARVAEHRKTLIQAMEQHLKGTERERPEIAPRPEAAPSAADSLRIGIVGGGAAGLYTAMLLDEMGIDYHVFEASGERLGGRVLTHYFDNADHQYAELGAMRFPENWMQRRLFDFWDHLNATVGSTPGAREIPRIPYVLFDPTAKPDAGNLLCYNDQPPVTRNAVTQDNSLLGFDPFFVDPEYDYFKDDQGRLKPAQTLLNAALEPFMQLLGNHDHDAAWAQVLEYDSFSARSYLQEVGDGVRPYPVRIVDYMESVLSYTGVYDLAFIELLLDNYSFEDTKAWVAMDGGTSRITQEMANRVPSSNVTMGAQVFRVEEADGRAVVHYRTGDGELTQTRDFDRVVVTLPFSVLRFLDTPRSWSPEKYEAIRSLKMINAVKVALGFKSRFWERSGPHSARMAGGQSNTDLPVRSVVYPSFGIGEPGPGYILASYCWQNDADKFSHLTEEQMFEACLRDVVRLHGDVAREEYLGHGASVVWNEEPLAGGGFEFFGPGQFLEKFIAAREPEGLFHFAGEHLDMVHYWIAGSLDSAFRVVWEVLILEGLLNPESMGRLRDALGGGLILPSMVPHFGIDRIEELAAEIVTIGAVAADPGASNADTTVDDSEDVTR